MSPGRERCRGRGQLDRNKDAGADPAKSDANRPFGAQNSNQSVMAGTEM
jgi:hypothetical protein